VPAHAAVSRSGARGRRAGAAGWWTIAAWALASIVAVPVLAVSAGAAVPDPVLWAHLAATILPEITLNTLALLIAVGVATGGLGTTLAWLVAAHDFPGRRWFDWALLLPLALPAYVLGFVYLALLDFTGPVQTAWRGIFGGGARLPDVRSFGGLVAVLTLALYPYPYLLARSAFADLGAASIDVARSLGLTARQTFWRVAVPLGRPAIAAGVALACMEALADFGTVSLFDHRTFTVAIYRVWFGMFDRAAAGQLAALLLVLAVVLLAAERWARRRARYVQGHGRRARHALAPLGGWRAWVTTVACSTVLAVAVVLPLGVLAWWSAAAGPVSGTSYAALVANTLALSFAAAVITLVAAVVLAYGKRLARSRALAWAAGIAGLGYALPGSVVAVGVLLVITPADHAISDAVARLLGRDVGLVLGASAVALLFAYVVRFMAISLGSVEAGLDRIAPSLDEIARSLGAAPRRVLGVLHVPLLRGALITAFLLVFVDVMKELPATMLIRPFGWDTLAIEVWQATTESLWHRAALPALTIAAAGMLPVVALTWLRRDAVEVASPRRPPPVRHVEKAIVSSDTGRKDDGREVAVSLEGVTRQFAESEPPAVEGLTLHVSAGEILALLGPSGCGKTTTLRLIAGFDAPDEGRITVGGRVVADRTTHVPPERRGLSVVFQDAALFPHLTVARNVAFGLSGRPGVRRRERVAEMLALCGLAGFDARYPHELSGGEQQRVALARALAPGHGLVALDEPLSSLDLPLRMALRGQLRQILERAGATAIFVTHDREEAFEVADRIAVMRGGRIQQVGTVEDIYRAPASPFVAEFVADVSRLPGTVTPAGVATEVGVLANPTGLPQGAPACVLLRWSALRIAADPSSPHRVAGRMFRGPVEIVTVRLASGREVRCQCEPADAPPLDTCVRIDVDRQRVLVFPAEAGSWRD
jgi:iron(III) transport system permease protein